MTQMQHSARMTEPMGAPPPAYIVRLNGARRNGFVDIRDAIASAKIAKNEHPHDIVEVSDVATGQVLLEIDV